MQSTTAASLFQRTLDLLNNAAPLKASFDDFTGVTLDYPQLLLPVSYEIHTCAACMYAKTESAGAHACWIIRGIQGFAAPTGCPKTIMQTPCVHRS